MTHHSENKSNDQLKWAPAISTPGQPLSKTALKALAKFHKRPVSDICCMCGVPIVVQIFRNSGVCCEQHRKDRDNDHLPFRGGQLNA